MCRKRYCEGGWDAKDEQQENSKTKQSEIDQTKKDKKGPDLRAGSKTNRAVERRKEKITRQHWKTLPAIEYVSSTRNPGDGFVMLVKLILTAT